MYVDKFKLDGRVAVVTGGASGIGWACVEALVDAGASQVVIADASEANIEQTRDRAAALRCVSLEAFDVTDSSAIEGFAQRMLMRLDALVLTVTIPL